MGSIELLHTILGAHARPIGRMLRNGAARLLARSNAKLPTSLLRNSCTLSPIKTKTTSNAFAIGFIRPSGLAVSLYKPVTAISFRYATTAPTGPGFDRPDKKLEEKVATSEIKPHPEAVSTDSSVRHILREEGVDDVERDVDMLAGVKSDLVGPIVQLAYEKSHN